VFFTKPRKNPQNSKVKTLFRCQTFGLEIEAYLSSKAFFAKHNNSNLWDSIIHGFFLHNLEPLCLAKITESTEVNFLIPNSADWLNTAIGMNHVVSNEMFWYSAEI